MTLFTAFGELGDSILMVFTTFGGPVDSNLMLYRPFGGRESCRLKCSESKFLPLSIVSDFDLDKEIQIPLEWYCISKQITLKDSRFSSISSNRQP